MSLLVIDRMAIEVARGKGTERLFEGEPLAIPFAVSLRFNAVVARRLTLVTLDSASATSWRKTVCVSIGSIRQASAGGKRWKKLRRYLLKQPVFVLFLVVTFLGGCDG